MRRTHYGRYSRRQEASNRGDWENQGSVTNNNQLSYHIIWHMLQYGMSDCQAQYLIAGINIARSPTTKDIDRGNKQSVNVRTREKQSVIDSEG